MKYGVNVLIFFTLLFSVVSAVRQPPRSSVFRRHRLTPPTPRRDASEVSEQWFDQLLDHFDSSSSTWSQRYQINADYYNNGPIFLYISGEGEADPGWLQGGFMIDLVVQYSGLAFQLEHRFYGQSQPTGDMSLNSLQYLTTEQAIADAAYFIQSMKNQYQGKWIVFGGSYAAGLAALMRIKYPDLVQGAVASSAQMQVQTDFSGFYQNVGSVMKRSNPSCYDDVATATQQLHQFLQSQDGVQQVTQIFNLCESLDTSNVNDVYMLQDAYPGTFGVVVQYDSYTFSDTGDLCSKLKDTSNGATELARLASLVTSGDYCTDYNFDNYRYYYTDASDDRAWMYQTCTEYGDFLTTDSSNQPFTNGVPTSYYADICTYVFGDGFNIDRVNQGVASTNTLLGNLHPDVTNVVFTQGSADPWHTLGILQDLSSSAPAIIIEDFTHAADLNSAYDDDPPQMQAAHERIQNLVYQWLQE